MQIDELAVTARLAAIELKDEELDELEKAVSEMLEYFAVMNTFDVSGLEPTTHAFYRENSTRGDVVRVFENTEQLIAAAPESEERFIVIPNVL